MALNPGTKWPTQTTAPDANYPYGSAKAASGPTATDGTPRDVDFINDLWGFCQKLLNRAGITPSGNAETILASDYSNSLDAIYGPYLKFITGYELSNNSVDKYDLDIAQGECVSTFTPARMLLAGSLVKQIDANWAAGTNAGGFPSGLTLTNGTWYHVFAIAKADGADVDAGFDTSLTAANLLSDASGSGYTLFRRIGSVYYVDGTTKIQAFHQKHDHFYWDSGPLDLNNVTPGTRTAYAISVPPSFELTALLSVFLNANTAVRHTAELTHGAVGAGAPNGYQIDIQPAAAVATFAGGYQITLLTDASQQIYAQQLANSPNISVRTIGWIDPRGQE